MKSVALWWRAVRPFAFSASVIPVALGTVVASLDMTGFRVANLFLFIFTLLGVVSLHSAGNLINDYFDHKKGIDSGTYGSRGVLVTGEMTPAVMLKGIIVFFIVGMAFGIALCILRGVFVAVLGAAGIILAVAYTGYPIHMKYRGFGDLVIVLAFGPLVVLGSYMVQTQTFSWTPVFIAIPITFLVDAILHANNTRDLDIDRNEKITTLAILLGEKGAIVFYDILLLGAYVSVLVLVLLDQVVPFTIATFITLPLAFGLHKQMKNRKLMKAKDFAFIDARTAQLHMFFGALLTLSLLVPHFLS